MKNEKAVNGEGADNVGTLLQEQRQFVRGAYLLARLSKQSMLSRIANHNRALDPASNSNMYLLANRNRNGSVVNFRRGSLCMVGQCPGSSAPLSYCGDCEVPYGSGQSCMSSVSPLWSIGNPQLRVAINFTVDQVVNLDAGANNCGFPGNAYGNSSCNNNSAVQLLAMWYFTPPNVGYNPTKFLDTRTGITYYITDFIYENCVWNGPTPEGFSWIGGPGELSFLNCGFDPLSVIENNYRPTPSPLTFIGGNCPLFPPTVFNADNNPNLVIEFTSPVPQ